MSSGGHKTSAIPRPKAATRSGTRTHGKPKKGSVAARASKRPAEKQRPGKQRPEKRSAEKQKDDSRFADFTRPIPVEKQLVRGGIKRRVIWIGGAVITSAFVAALFVLPVQAWLRQQDDLDRKEEQLAAIRDANSELANEVRVLQTPEGIEQAAREEIGYVQQGETRFTVMPTPDAPITLPGGWPYTTVTQIVAVRTADLANP